MIISYDWKDNKNLMVTHSDDATKILHKVGTDEYYDDPIDLREGYIAEGPRAGQPYCRFEYEEVDRPQEENNDDNGTDAE